MTCLSMLLHAHAQCSCSHVVSAAAAAAAAAAHTHGKLLLLLLQLSWPLMARWVHAPCPALMRSPSRGSSQPCWPSTAPPRPGRGWATACRGRSRGAQSRRLSHSSTREALGPGGGPQKQRACMREGVGGRGKRVYGENNQSGGECMAREVNQGEGAWQGRSMMGKGAHAVHAKPATHVSSFPCRSLIFPSPFQPFSLYCAFKHSHLPPQAGMKSFSALELISSISC